MMFVALLALVFLCRSAAADDIGPEAEVKLQALKDASFSSEWKKYKSAVEGDTTMLSSSKSALKIRKRMFRKALKRAIANNEDPTVEYISGINEMSFMTKEEKSSFTGFNISRIYNARMKRASARPATVAIEKRSSTTWWSESNTYVTAIKDQGDCGSCWAFAAVAVLESMAKIAGGSLIQLSEQEIIDCNSDGSHCEGGLMDFAWSYVQKSGRLAASADYAYAGKKGSCYGSYYSNALTRLIASFSSMPGENNEDMLATKIDSGPVAIAIHVSDNFVGYISGRFNEAVDVDPNHAVVAIGYDSNRFLVRNSWGTNWGLVGHIYLRRGLSNTISLYYHSAWLTMNSNKEKEQLE